MQQRKRESLTNSLNTKWQVSEFLVDEAQQFEEEQVVYFMSRLRSEAKMKPYMRMTCNPDKNSFLRKWIDWYLLEGSGLPDPAKCGVLRYLVVREGQMFWGDSREEMLERFGPKAKPLSFTFIAANVYDNPVLMERQPEYVSWLEGLPRVEKARLLDGDWDATEQAAGYFKREWCNIVTSVPCRTIKRVRAWDLASTVPSESYPNPDWTVGVLMTKQIDNCYTVEHVTRFRDRFQGVEQAIFNQALYDGPETTIILAQDPGAAGKVYVQGLSRALAERGYTVRIRVAHNSKVVRFGPFCSVAEAKSVRVLKADWNEVYFTELENFTGQNEKMKKDDQVDATGDAFWGCKTGLELPNFKLPDLARTQDLRATA